METGCPTTLTLSPEVRAARVEGPQLEPGRDQRGQLVLDAGRHRAVGQRVDDPLDVALAEGERHPALGQPQREVLAVHDDPPRLAGGQRGFRGGLGRRLGGGLGRWVRSGLDGRRRCRVEGRGCRRGGRRRGDGDRRGPALATWPTAALEGAGEGVDPVQPASRSARPRARRLAGGRAAIEAPVDRADGGRDVVAGPRWRECARPPSGASMRRWSRSASPGGLRSARPPRRRPGAADRSDRAAGQYRNQARATSASTVTGP